MKTEVVIRRVVKVLPVYQPSQKIHFSVRHPENAIALIGIAVTGTNAQRSGGDPPAPDLTGTLSLAIPQKGDVFYTEDVHAEEENFSEYAESAMQTTFIDPAFGFSGKRLEYFDTCVEITEASMEGLYVDTTANRGGGIISGGGLGGVSEGGPGDLVALYKIVLYLKYQVEEEDDC